MDLFKYLIEFDHISKYIREYNIEQELRDLLKWILREESPRGLVVSSTLEKIKKKVRFIEDYREVKFGWYPQIRVRKYGTLWFHGVGYPLITIEVGVFIQDVTSAISLLCFRDILTSILDTRKLLQLLNYLIDLYDNVRQNVRQYITNKSIADIIESGKVPAGYYFEKEVGGNVLVIDRRTGLSGYDITVAERSYLLELP